MKFIVNYLINSLFFRPQWGGFGVVFSAIFLSTIGIISLAPDTANSAIRGPAIIGSAAGSPIKTLALLNGKIYLLDDGPLSLCPETLGFTTSLAKKSIRIFPLQDSSDSINQEKRPFLEIRNLQSGNFTTAESEVDENHIRRIYLANLNGDSIRSIVTTQISEGHSITSNAEINFLKNGIRLARWSAATGEPLQNHVECTYTEKSKKKKTLAQR